MARLPKLVQELCDTERIELKNHITINKNTFEVLAKDGREFTVFNNSKIAKEYAIDVFVKNEDDPTMLKQLRWMNKTINQYAIEQVEENGAQWVLSYDQHHKTKLQKDAVAYRIL